MHWLWGNRQWVFSGAGVTAVVAAYYFLRSFFRPAPAAAIKSGTVSPGRDNTVATGSNITQTLNSPTTTDNSSRTVNVTLPSPPANTHDRARYDEWRELTAELHEAFQQIGYAFFAINALSPDGSNDYRAGIQRGYHAIRSRIVIAKPLIKARILQKYEEIVQYALSARNPRNPNQRGCPTMTGFDLKAASFEDELFELARVDINSIPIAPIQKGERRQLLRELTECVDRLLRNCPELAYTIPVAGFTQKASDWPDPQRKEFNDAALDGARAIENKLYIADELERENLLERWQLLCSTSDASQLLAKWKELRNLLIGESVAS